MIHKLPSCPDCYVCGKNNNLGFHQEFFIDVETQTVFTEYTPPANHAGYRDIVHGGIFLTMLDEVMAWACICQEKNPCLTTRMETKFIKKATCGSTYRVSATVDRTRGRMLFTSSTVNDSSGKIYYQAKGVYLVEHDADFIQCLEDGDFTL